MCGIVGMISKNQNGFFKNEVDGFHQLLWADQLRGTNGTGVFFDTGKEKTMVHIIKDALPASQFLYDKEYDKIDTTLIKSSRFIIGHNRAATKGSVTKANTHPFRERNITLVHNGTLLTHKELGDKEVDSHAIAESMSKIGYKETIKKIDGAFALVWFDTKEGTLNLCRNSQRPLSIVETKDCYIISSEATLGEWIADRNNMKWVATHDVTPLTLYRFNINNTNVWEEEKVEAYKWTGGRSKDYNKSFSFWGDKHHTQYNNTKNYTIGEKVRFCLGYVRSEDPFGTYIEGDLVTFQKIKKQYIGKHSYEDKFRIKYYTEDKTELIHWPHEEDVVGTIKRVTWLAGVPSYIVTDIHEYVEEEPKTALTVVHNPVQERICDDCNKVITGDVHKQGGFVLCEECNILYAYGN